MSVYTIRWAKNACKRQGANIVYDMCSTIAEAYKD
jgi:hypothetical protein